MNNQLAIANMFNVLAYLSDDIESFHFGYLEDIGVSQNNNFNVDLDTQKKFPHLQLLPMDGFMDLNKMRDRVNVEVRLWNLLGVDNGGELVGKTKGEYWYELGIWLTRVLREFNKGTLGEGKVFKVIGGVEWFNDVDNVVDQMIFTGARFQVEFIVDCEDVEFDFGTLPDHLPYPVNYYEDYEENRPEEVIEEEM